MVVAEICVFHKAFVLFRVNSESNREKLSKAAIGPFSCSA